MNVQNSPVDVGFYGPERSHLWCSTATETLHFWGWADAAAEPDKDADAIEQEALQAASADMLHVPDAREYLSACLRPHKAFRGEVWCIALRSSPTVTGAARR